MSLTEKLLRVFRVDQQLQGLESRLKAAEKFHDDQTRQLDALQTQQRAIGAQLRQLQAEIGEEEVEAKAIDARTEKLREQMNHAKTNKEYQAFLVEVNTLKADRSLIDTAALEKMTKVDELRKQLAEVDAKAAERAKVRGVAASERDKRADEIRDRVNELRRERAGLAVDVPKDAMAVYAELLSKRGDDAMAPVEVQDRKRHEATCGACMMSVPVETISTLISGSRLITCVSCGCILYMEREAAEQWQPASSKR